MSKYEEMEEYDAKDESYLVNVPLNKSLITASSLQMPFKKHQIGKDNRIEEIKKANSREQKDQIYWQPPIGEEEDDKYFHSDEVGILNVSEW
jgi:hypothetical protein